jgi:thiol-disulfide isomerase/thioredoxin
MPMRRPKFRAVLFQVLLLLSVAGQALAAPPARGPQVGDIPPARLGEDADGKPVSLADYDGKVVVLSFWTSSCGYCLKELPALDALQRELGTQALQVVAVNLRDSSKDYGVMLKQMRDYALLPLRDASGEIGNAWGVQIFPNLWVIGADGRVASHREDYYEDALPGILAGIRSVVAAQPQRHPRAD